MNNPSRCLPLLILLIPAFRVKAAEVEVFDKGRARVYLDVTEQEALELGLRKPVEDLCTYFQRMTGTALPRAGGSPMLFDPGREELTRFEATVVRMEDASNQSSVNADAGLCLSPTLTFPSQPFAGPGEKVGWTCAWDRGARKLTFALTVANEPYYGPGFGPFTAATLTTDAPDWAAGGHQSRRRFADASVVKLALETRRTGLRGGYCLSGGDWRYTDWFDPTTAGTDTREPGKSDRNGPQAWSKDWPNRWANGTAFFVTAYAAMARQATVCFDDVRVTRGEDVLFASDFTAEGISSRGFRNWCLTPYTGTGSVVDGVLVLRPQVGGWNTVGVRANRPPEVNPQELIPLRIAKPAYPAAAKPYDAREVQGFRLNVSPKAITLSAGTRLGLQNGLYYLLQRWGCRWVMVGDLGECIPRVQRLTLPLGELRFSPRSDFSIEPCGSDSPYADFWNRNLGGWQNWLSAQHYWLYALPPEKHFANHPEWYSLIAGKRQPRQLCTSNPEVIAEMIRVAKAYLSGGTNRMSFPMDPMDCIDFCECANCRALDPPGRFTSGALSVTDRVLHFVNAVADGIHDEFPDRYIAFYAYWSHADLPVREKPRPNVIVGITRCNHCMVHLTPRKSCPTSDFHGFVRSWQKLTPNVYCYEYDPISWTGGLPCPTFLDMAWSLKTLLLDMGVKGSYSDAGVLPAAWAGTFLNRYIPLRMKVDPSQSPEQVLRETCQVFFGPAAAPMEQHYLEMAKVTDTTHPGRGSIGVGTTFYHELFNPAQMARARAALDRGLNAVRDQSPYQQRVAMVDLSQQYLEAYLGGVWAAQAKHYNQAVANFDRMDRALTALAEKKWVDAVDAPGRAKTMRLKALAEHFSQRLGYVTDWKLLGPFDNSSVDADQRRDVFEPVTSAEVPVKLPNGEASNWWDYHSPGGFLNLERAVAKKKGAWTLSYCYAATTVQSPRAVPAQIKLDSFFPFRVFLNGEEVLYRPGLNADCPDRIVADARLRAGANLIVVKLCQTQVTTDVFPWGLYLRVVPNVAEEVVALPDQWAFRTDPKDAGTQEKWFSPELDDTAWMHIRVGQPWEASSVGPYDGYAWYRVRFTLPAKLPEGNIAFQFGGVDEQAWVYLNGETLGERTVKSTGRTVGEIWEEPFSIAVPQDRLRPGADNLLVVKVHDSAFAGGIYRAVRLVVTRQCVKGDT